MLDHRSWEWLYPYFVFVQRHTQLWVNPTFQIIGEKLSNKWSIVQILWRRIPPATALDLGNLKAMLPILMASWIISWRLGLFSKSGGKQADHCGPLGYKLVWGKSSQPPSPPSHMDGSQWVPCTKDHTLCWGPKVFAMHRAHHIPQLQRSDMIRQI